MGMVCCFYIFTVLGVVLVILRLSNKMYVSNVLLWLAVLCVFLLASSVLRFLLTWCEMTATIKINKYDKAVLYKNK